MPDRKRMRRMLLRLTPSNGLLGRGNCLSYLYITTLVLALCISSASARRSVPQLRQNGIRWGLRADPLTLVQQLTDCLYNKNDLNCIDQYCQPTVVVHGDGVWLPATEFSGSTWAKNIHQDWFAEYTQWSFRFLDIGATSAVKGFTEVVGFFTWYANNTGSYHGLNPSNKVSHDYGLMHLTVDKKGLVTDVSIWRSGFAEERQGLLNSPEHEDLITPCHDITEQPFWIPSRSLQLKMNTRAHALLEVLNQGEKFLDSIDDMCVDGVVMLDGMYVWGPPKLTGLTDLKLWLAAWMARYTVNVAVTASVVTSNSDKVFLCFRMLLNEPGPSTSTTIQGCLLYVFNIQGFITHMVMYRSGTLEEMNQKFIGRRGPSTWPGTPARASHVHRLSVPPAEDPEQQQQQQSSSRGQQLEPMWPWGHWQQMAATLQGQDRGADVL